MLYGVNGIRVEMEDRTLAHVQAVVVDKLSQSESFALSWTDHSAAGSERTTVWMHPGVTLRFRYYGSRAPVLNKAWLGQLAQLADSNGSLYCTPEPAERRPINQQPTGRYNR